MKPTNSLRTLFFTCIYNMASASDFNTTAPRCLIGLWSEERCLLSENYVARVSGKSDKVDTFERVLPRCRQGVGRWVSTTAQAGVDISAPRHPPLLPPRAAALARAIEAEAAAYIASLEPAPEVYDHRSYASSQFCEPPSDAAGVAPAMAAARAAARHPSGVEPHDADLAKFTAAPSPSRCALSRLPLHLQSRETQLTLAPVIKRIVGRLAAAGSSMADLAANARAFNPAALAHEARSAACIIPPAKVEKSPAGDDIVLARALREAARAMNAALADADIEQAARVCAPARGVIKAKDDIHLLWVSLTTLEALEGLVM